MSYTTAVVPKRKGGKKAIEVKIDKSGVQPQYRKADKVRGKESVLETHYTLMDAAAVEPLSAYQHITVHPAGSQKGARDMDASSEAALANSLVAEVANTSSDVKALCETYHLRREELGRLTGFSLRALAEWATGKLPSQPAKRRLQEVRRLLDSLSEIVKRERIPAWLHQPNPAFDQMTPLQVIELGEIDRLWAMLHDLGSGQPI